MNVIRGTAIAVIISTAIVACGSSGSAPGPQGNTPPPQGSSSPGGIWTGNDSATGLSVTVLVEENGQFDAIRSDGAQFYGTLTFISGSLNAQLVGISQYGTAFSDGSHHGTGQLTGTYSPQSEMTMTVDFTTDAKTSVTSELKLKFNSAYLITPDVYNLDGNYSDQTGIAVTISGAGLIFSQDPSTGCVVNGNIHTVDSRYSLYAPLIDYANCTGSDSTLNGASFDGFMTVIGSTVIAGLHDKSGFGYGIVYTLTKE